MKQKQTKKKKIRREYFLYTFIFIYTSNEFKKNNS